MSAKPAAAAQKPAAAAKKPAAAAAAPKAEAKKPAAKKAKMDDKKTEKKVAVVPKKVHKVAIVRYVIDCRKPVQDGYFDVPAYEKFLRDKIKVDGKAGQLKDKVRLLRQNAKILISAEAPFSKRYLKYLTKKYLKKENLRDYLRVVALSKNAYELRYFKVDQAGEADEDPADKE